MNALVVEDNADAALSLDLLLRSWGCVVQVVHFGLDAMAEGDRSMPNVGFLDIGLPDTSGHDVCMEMRGRQWGAKAFIVALTGRDEPNDVIRTALTGFDRHVSKPMEPSMLLEILKLAKSKAEAQIAK